MNEINGKKDNIDVYNSYYYKDSKVFINKRDIREQKNLETYESVSTALRMLELNNNPIKGNHDLEHWQKYIIIYSKMFILGLVN